MEYTRAKRWKEDLTVEAGDKLFYKYLEPSLTPKLYETAIQGLVPVTSGPEPGPRGTAASGNAVIALIWHAQQRDIFL